MVSNLVQSTRDLMRSKIFRYALIVSVMFVLSAMSVMAQTPMPTLYIPTTDIIVATNAWTPQISQLVSTGLGAALAITLVLFVGGILLYAIRGALKQTGFLGGGR